MFTIAAAVVLAVLAAIVTLSVGYLLALAVVYFAIPDRPVNRVQPAKRFGILIPAHNEELIIETALRSWQAVLYPRNLFTIHIIADNCTDRTAEIGRHMGVLVWERRDEANRGKGQALAWALDTIDLRTTDALVIVDADTAVDKDFLAVMNDRLMAGDQVVQGYDGVMNPYENAMTCLMQVTNVMKNLLFNYAKSKVGLSVQLMGTGMCLDKAVMKQVGWKAFSIGEDGEQFAYMVRAGIHVTFEPRAKVYAHEASSFQQAYTQRVRWSAGRMQLSHLGWRLLMEAVQERSLGLADAAMTFLLPNYAMLANMVIAGLGAAAVFTALPGRMLLLWWFSLLLVALIGYFLTGLAMSRPPKRLLGSLAFTPLFLIWKIGIDVISLFQLKKQEWVRTSRASDQDARTKQNL